MKKKTVKKLVLAKETVRSLAGLTNMELRAVAGADTEKTVCWSVVCSNSMMYTCECHEQPPLY